MRRIWFSFLILGGIGTAQTAKLLPLPVPIPLPRPGTGAAVPPAAVVVLKGLAARAGVIFAGHVLEVQRNESAGYVDVVFGVDRAVRGCAVGSKYVVREWAGLWAEEPRRYGVGQRLLMILSARSPSGLSAPVDGMEGKIPVVGVRTGPLARGGSAILPDTGAGLEEAVDLRWVEAAEVRTMASGAKARAEMKKSEGWAGPVGQTVAVPAGVVGPGLSAVLAVLGGE